MKHFLLIAFTLLLSIAYVEPSSGGYSVGNGGDGYREGEQVYLWDLLERSLHLEPNLSEEVEIDLEILQLLERSLVNLQGLDVETLARKISAISQSNFLFALKLQYAIQALSWSLAPLPLLNIQDEDSVLEMPQENMLQLAVRQDSDVLIDRFAWMKLDRGNRVALVLHEALFFMVVPESVGNKETKVKKQDSRKVRSLVGHLFSPSFATSSLIHSANFRFFDASDRNDLLVDEVYFKLRNDPWTFYAGGMFLIQVDGLPAKVKSSLSSSVLLKGEFVSISPSSELSQNTVLVETAKKACITTVNALEENLFSQGILIRVLGMVPIGAFYVSSFMDSAGRSRVWLDSDLRLFEAIESDGVELHQPVQQSVLAQLNIVFASKSLSVEKCVESIFDVAEKMKSKIDEFYHN